MKPVFFQQRFYKKAAAFVLRAVAKHSPQLAQVQLSMLIMLGVKPLFKSIN